jgi:RNA polymerase sigma-70 factor (ECF subfamily)
MNPADQFEAMVSEHYEPLYKFAMNLTCAESDALDLTQQTFYVWAKKGHQLRDFSKVKSWLFTTLHREFLVARRRKSRFLDHELDEVAAELPDFSPKLADHVDSSEVLSALARVDEAFQPAVALFYLEGRSYKDIAGTLGVPIGTVKSRLARGLAQLRAILLSGELRPSSPTFEVPALAGAASGASQSANCLKSERQTAETKPDYDEWDYSSTLLPEPPGFECMINPSAAAFGSGVD